MINEAIVSYFKQAIMDTEKFNGKDDFIHLSNKLNKYLESEEVNNETKKEILRLFTTSEQGVKKITVDSICCANSSVKKISLGTINYINNEGIKKQKTGYGWQIVINTKYLKITSKLVRG